MWQKQLPDKIHNGLGYNRLHMLHCTSLLEYMTDKCSLKISENLLFLSSRIYFAGVILWTVFLNFSYLNYVWIMSFRCISVSNWWKAALALAAGIFFSSQLAFVYHGHQQRRLLFKLLLSNIFIRSTSSFLKTFLFQRFSSFILYANTTAHSSQTVLIIV